MFGFRDALVTLVAGAIQGSTGSTVTLAVKIQESASATGTNWTDITDEGALGGSAAFTTLTFGGGIAGGDTTGTWLPYQMGKEYVRLADGTRQRYVRAHATLNGTIGLGPKFAVTFLLGRPVDTLYAANGVVVPSGNVQLTKLL